MDLSDYTAWDDLDILYVALNPTYTPARTHSCIPSQSLSDRNSIKQLGNSDALQIVVIVCRLRMLFFYKYVDRSVMISQSLPFDSSH